MRPDDRTHGIAPVDKVPDRPKVMQADQKSIAPEFKPLVESQVIGCRIYVLHVHIATTAASSSASVGHAVGPRYRAGR